MKYKEFRSNKANWTVKDSESLYGLDRWGGDYFSINKLGNIAVNPQGPQGASLDLMDLVKELESRNLNLPLLIRFDDILEDRLTQLNEAFKKAITYYDYQGIYQGVFPVKCNQNRYVLEEITSCGHRWHFGLEAGSKAELLIALSLVKDPTALLICNGYKDQRYIETTILARQLGRKPIVVVEQIEEVDRIIAASDKLGASPLIGIRAKLASRSSGRWGSSVGERAKFGLSAPEILEAVEKLKEANLLKDLRLLHFHVGSQINDIGILKDALQEAGQIYVELQRLGGAMEYLDVGGGLGVDYDGSQTASDASTNYSLQNYANDVVATIKECCEANSVKEPILVSESGRAIASHFSVLVFNILGKSCAPSTIPKPKDNESIIIRNLRETLETIKDIPKKNYISSAILQEAWNDAIKFKDDALIAFRLGYISLTERSTAEQLTGVCIKVLVELLEYCESIPEELKTLNSIQAETYYANLSIFRSAPDTWAINQLFPVIPIHKLNEEPTQLGHFADLTCDSDGKLSRFIGNGQEKSLLELHHIKPKEQYIIGLFLGGAYQEVMGNMHNLFGSTNSVHLRLSQNGSYKLEHVIRGNTKADVLKAMEHDPEELLERLRVASEEAIQKGTLKINDAQRLLDHLETSLRQSTYLQ